MPETLLTSAEVARRVGVSRQTVRNWAVSGELAAIRLPGRGLLRFDPADVDRLLQTLATDQSPVAS